MTRSDAVSTVHLLGLRFETALFRMDVPAAVQLLHWRNRHLIARSHVANKLGRVISTLPKGPRPEDPRDH